MRMSGPRERNLTAASRARRPIAPVRTTVLPTMEVMGSLGGVPFGADRPYKPAMANSGCERSLEGYQDSCTDDENDIDIYKTMGLTRTQASDSGYISN